MLTGIVVGVVVGTFGALANYFASISRDKSQRTYEEKNRYQADRLSAYARFFRTTEIGLPLQVSDLPTEDELRVLSDGYAETLILSTTPVHDAAIQLYRAHARARKVTLEDGYTEEELRTDPEELAVQRRNAFLEAVRKELNITLPVP